MRQSTARLGEYTPTSNAAPGRALPTHRNRSGATIHGSSSIAFGSVFVVAGITVGMLALLGYIDASRSTPAWLVPVVGALFAIAGLSIVAQGFAALAIHRRVRCLRETYARQPWVWDHPWDESGSRDDSGRRIGRAIWAAAFLALFMVPVNWIGFFSPGRPLLFAIAAVLGNCVVVGCGWWAVYLMGRRAKYGVSTLRFHRFPFRPGDEVELHLARPSRLAGVEAPEALLRCVQERWQPRQGGKDGEEDIVAFEVWSATRTAEFQRGEYVWRFALPEGLPGTALSEQPPRYWELELKIETAGMDYAGTFLVPIYEDGRRR